MASSSSQYCRRSLPDTSARLPALTNVVRPSPRFCTFSRIAEPSAPDWQKKPARPRGGITEESEALSVHVGVGVDDAEGVGADQAQAVGAGQPDQAPLPHPALLAGLGEARRDHDQAVHALGGAVEHDVLHRLGRDGDDGDVDVAGDVADRLPRRHPGDRVGAGVDHVDPPGEVAEHEVAHQRPTDGVLPPAGADDRDRLRRRRSARSRRTRPGARAAPSRRSRCRSGRSGTPAPSRRPRTCSSPGSRRRGRCGSSPGCRAAPRRRTRSIPRSRPAWARCSSRSWPMPRPWWASSTRKATSA